MRNTAIILLYAIISLLQAPCVPAGMQVSEVVRRLVIEKTTGRVHS